jgi:hypothetical protein
LGTSTLPILTRPYPSLLIGANVGQALLIVLSRKTSPFLGRGYKEYKVLFLPGRLAQRYSELYRKFADAWRVTKKDSLFDYAPGTSTNTFTDRVGRSEKAPCVVPEKKPVEPTTLEIAEAACRRVADPDRLYNVLLIDNFLRFSASNPFLACIKLNSRAAATRI